MKTSKTILGILGGVAIGAILGILYPPNKGSKTRKKIIKKTNKTKNKLKDNYSQFIDTVSEKYNSIVANEEELMEKGKEELKKLKNEFSK